ncbi:sugar transporter SWEET1 [Cynoglossus semilaevis]|uniref:Sugar transporter SWEET1 n=1 Tax=Cynoglossus semilaevis TaxID=244447 RepID=A0A3P8URG2_CYNSE|nr:sugar transporter SWEET1 [Cynoglossus semilaevis]
MEYLELLSWTCIVFTVGMFSTGLPDLKRMIHTKSTENIQFLPYLATCLNNFGWFYYGMLKLDHTIILVNVIGAVLQCLYIITFTFFTKQKKLVLIQTLTAAAMLLFGWFYFSRVLIDDLDRINQMGLTCFVITICMYMSPLADLMTVIRTGNIQCLSFSLTVATFFTSTSWVLYGLQLHDNFIVGPNSPGIITSLIRFYLFWKFASANQSSPSYKLVPI